MAGCPAPHGRRHRRGEARPHPAFRRILARPRLRDRAARPQRLPVHARRGGLPAAGRDAERRRRRRAAHQPARAASRAGPEASRHTGVRLARCGRLLVQCGAVPLAAGCGGQAPRLSCRLRARAGFPGAARAVPIAAGSAPVRSPGRRPSKAVSRSSPAVSAARCPRAGRKRWPARACRLWAMRARACRMRSPDIPTRRLRI